MGKKIVWQLLTGLFALCVPVLALSGCSSEDGTFSKDDINLLSRSVYNAAVKDNEAIHSVTSSSVESENCFDSLSIVDSFFIETSFDSDLEPFFPSAFKGAEIGTVVALLQFDNERWQGGHFYMDMVIFEFEDQVEGFLNPYSSSDHLPGSTNGDGTRTFYRDDDYQANFCLSVGSYVYLTKDKVVVDCTGDRLYTFYLSRYEGVFSLETALDVSTSSADRTYIPSSVVPDTYAQLAQDEVIDLVSQAIVESVSVEAVIISMSEDKKTLGVSSEQAPTLRSIQYRSLVAADGSVLDPQTSLAIGSHITVSYYLRYKGYTPVNIFSNSIKLA